MCFSPTALPSIVDLPAPVTHMKGDGFLLTCSFTGVPLPNILWEKDGSVFLLGEGRRVINSTGKSQLEIKSLAFSDGGLYSCSVKNVAGTDMRSVRLKVEGKIMQLVIIIKILCLAYFLLPTVYM